MRIDARIGSVLAERYRLDAVLATGGIGAVYAAEDLVTTRRVALKMLFRETEGFPILAARMDREGLVGQHLHHRNVVKALDFGTLDDGCRYVVTELVRGRTLRELMKDGPLPIDRSLSLMRQLLEALRACHQLDVLHRDLKPRNIIIDESADDRLTLIDFGLARVPVQLIGDDADGPLSGDDLSTQQQLTTSGIVFGTLAYMAPETALGMAAVDKRSDLYSAGVMFYELVAGKHPFDATDPTELFLQHRVMPPPPLAERAPDVHVLPAIEAVIMRMLAKRPGERFSSATEVLAALKAAQLASIADVARPTLRTTSSLQNATVITVAPTSRSLGSDADANERRPSSDELPLPRRARGGRLQIAAIVASILFAAVAWRAASQRGAATEPALEPLQSRGPFLIEPPPPVAPTAWPERDAARTRFRTQVELGRWRTASAALRELLEPARPGEVLTPLADAADRERAQRVALKAAYGDFPDVEALFDALAERAGHGGLDVLYAMVEAHGESRGANLARERLLRPGVRSRLSPALASAMALRDASCKKKPELFQQAGEVGDERTLRVLDLLRPPRCDARRGECCLWKHEGLESASRAIEARSAER